MKKRIILATILVVSMSIIMALCLAGCNAGGKDAQTENIPDVNAYEGVNLKDANAILERAAAYVEKGNYHLIVNGNGYTEETLSENGYYYLRGDTNREGIWNAEIYAKYSDGSDQYTRYHLDHDDPNYLYFWFSGVEEGYENMHWNRDAIIKQYNLDNRGDIIRSYKQESFKYDEKRGLFVSKNNSHVTMKLEGNLLVIDSHGGYVALDGLGTSRVHAPY